MREQDPYRVRLAPADWALVVAITAVGGVALALMFAQPLAAAGLVFTACLAWLSVIDLRFRLLPNALTLPLCAAGLALSPTSLGVGIWQSIAGAAVGYGVIAAIALAYRKSRGIEGIGFGDAKLLAALGSWLGIEALPETILLAALTGLLAYGLTRRVSALNMHHAIPFGPFLAIAGWAGFVALHKGFDLSRALGNSLTNWL